jgi:tight adherence protein C
MVAVMALAGALGGLGLMLFVRGLIGTTPSLAAVVVELHRPRHPQPTPRRIDVMVERLAGRTSASRAIDLAACDRTVTRFVQDRCVWALLGAAPGFALVVLSAGGAIEVSLPTVLVSLAVGGAAGWLWTRVDLRSDAERARREFRHALAGYLELVTILMAGGAGVETAMFDAVDAGTGAAFRQLRTSLIAAQARREAPWRQLGALGTRIGVGELEELEASMTLAGDGAQVRDSLTAKAAGIRMRDLAALESQAQARSETMVLPVALMFAGFLVLIGYPALAALSTP